MRREEYAIVLDFLSAGHAGDRRSEPIAQAIGEQFFSLLELAVKPDTSVKLGERLYIGPEKRDKVKYIKRKIYQKDLTNVAFSSLPEILQGMLLKHEKRFVNFFNHAGMITPRMHQFELLPGIGKKHVENILAERRKKPFESFEDIRNRVKLMPDPLKVIEKRVMEEMQGNQKYYLFVAGHQREV